MAGNSAASRQADPELAPVPVIVLSALDPARAAPVDADAFLKKPLDFDRLLELVRDALPLSRRRHGG